MKVWLVAALAWGISGVAAAQNAREEDGLFWIWGGQNSCATWLSSDEARAFGNEWIAGYWSGLNAHNDRNHMVGRNTDFQGIIGEIELLCRAEPSERISRVTGRVYVRLEDEGR